MVQERFNIDWIAENQLGVVLDSFAEVAGGILPMLDADWLLASFPRARARNQQSRNI